MGLVSCNTDGLRGAALEYQRLASILLDVRMPTFTTAQPSAVAAGSAAAAAGAVSRLLARRLESNAVTLLDAANAFDTEETVAVDLVRDVACIDRP